MKQTENENEFGCNEYEMIVEKKNSSYEINITKKCNKYKGRKK